MIYLYFIFTITAFVVMRSNRKFYTRGLTDNLQIRPPYLYDRDTDNPTDHSNISKDDKPLKYDDVLDLAKNWRVCHRGHYNDTRTYKSVHGPDAAAWGDREAATNDDYVEDSNVHKGRTKLHARNAPATALKNRARLARIKKRALRDYADDERFYKPDKQHAAELDELAAVERDDDPDVVLTDEERDEDPDVVLTEDDDEGGSGDMTLTRTEAKVERKQPTHKRKPRPPASPPIPRVTRQRARTTTSTPLAKGRRRTGHGYNLRKRTS